MRELNLRSKMIAAGSFILIFPVTIFGIIIYLNSASTLEKGTKHQFMQIASSMSTMIDVSLEKEYRVIDKLAKDPEIIDEASRRKNTITRKKLAALYISKIDSFEGIAAYDRNGIIHADGVDLSREGISISSRDYYKLAKSGKRGISSVLASQVSGTPIFVLSAPIMSSDGEFLGGIISVVKIDYIINYTESFRIGNTGYAFMLDANGLLIAHPYEKEILYRGNLSERFGLEELNDDISKFRTGTIEYEFKNTEKLASFSRINISDWTLVVTQNKKEALNLASSNALYILLYGFLFLLLGVTALLYLSKQISTPVNKRLVTLNQAVEQASEVLVILDSEGNLQFFNQAAAKIMAEAPQRGDPFHLQDLEHQKILDIFTELEKKNVWNGRVHEKKEDENSFYTLNLSITPVLEKSGKQKSYLAIGRDITNELQLQKQLLHGQKMESIGILAGGIAHDFNNILSAIFSYTELALLALSDRKKLETYLKEIIKASIRAKELVDHILTFSYRSDEEIKPLVFKYILKDTLKLVRASLPSTIEIQEKLDSSAPIIADPSKLHQLIMNLCTNAAYSMKKEGGTLELVLKEVKTSDLNRKYSDATGKSYLQFDVRDTGTGISPKIIEKIFDPFFTTKPVGEGTGLGLSMVHGIVKNLRGFIDIISGSETGTTVSIFLPVIDVEVETEEEIFQRSYPKGREHILFVDDETAIIQSGQLRLERLGYQVSPFENSTEALGIFRNDPDLYDLIITDYTMPNLTGLDLVKEVRKIRSDIPVLVCSGYKDVEQLIVKMRAVSFMKKPVMTHELSTKLREILDK